MDWVQIVGDVSKLVGAAAAFGAAAGWVATRWISGTFIPRAEAEQKFAPAALAQEVSHLRTLQERDHENLRDEVREVKSTLESLRDYLMRRGG